MSNQEPANVTPYQSYTPGEGGARPIKDFRPTIVPSDTPEEEFTLTVEEVPREEEVESDDPKDDTAMVSVDSSKKPETSPEDASSRTTVPSVPVVSVASVSKPVVPSKPTS